MTAYEMLISDWSSDVCSSDLVQGLRRARQRAVVRDRQEILQLVPIHRLQICSFMLQVYPLQSVRSWSVADGKDRRETRHATDRPSYDRKSTRLNSSH